MARSKQTGVAGSVKIRPQRRLTQAELDIFLERAADLLRGGVDHSEFRGHVFALLFYKRINDVYLENVATLEKELGDPDLARDPRMHDFVVPDDCSIWEKVARTPERELGTALNDAIPRSNVRTLQNSTEFSPTALSISMPKIDCRAVRWFKSSIISASSPSIKRHPRFALLNVI